MGDQLNILWNLVQHDGKWIDQALQRAMTLRLRSANNFRDLLYSLKYEEEQIQPQATKKKAGTYSHITASTRDVDSYIAIMKGGHSA